jgi:type I restriction enzyme S subunit
LGEVVRLNYGKAIAKEVRGPVGPVPVYGANGVMDYCEDALSGGPSIIVGRKGSAGAINVAKGPFWASDVSYFTQHDTQKVEFSYLLHFLQQLDLPSLAKGVKPGINRDEVYAIQIPLPTLEEQQRIIAVLDEAFDGLTRARAHAEANLQNARELFGSSLQHSFSGESDDWYEKSLAELGTVQTGSTPRTSEAGNEGNFIPFIKPGDFRPDGTLDYDNSGLSEKGASVSRLVPAGSALMVCIGATIGKTGFTDRSITTNQQINSIAPLKGVSGEYLYYQFLTPEFQASVIHGSGQATLPIINKSKWSSLKVRLPRRSEAQVEIVERLSKLRAHLDEASRVYNEKLKDIDALRQSLLQKAFAGELA